ncbi:hypothetical protein LMG28727_06714 [Paraburkholderia kirstenboschensis]|uniref:hypothetical protein n=1 Tax=Paraburkholderia kirstenboschensis TaxID=1245436 RepID=UPI000AC20B43|nr:hypothetical protein [Paraburkholderia kirstenboschensis]CAD6558780.1 hypothetical protein LMG28727_06714 [Paraburkholderia kirstenboschensis]
MLTIQGRLSIGCFSPTPEVCEMRVAADRADRRASLPDPEPSFGDAPPQRPLFARHLTPAPLS